jgi:cell division protein FtsX
VTPATLRGRIAIRAELLRGVDVESVRYLNQQQQIAALERQLAALEGGR